MDSSFAEVTRDFANFVPSQVSFHAAALMEQLDGRATQDLQAAEVQYRILLAINVVSPADQRTPSGSVAPCIKVLYSYTTSACLYDIDLLETIYLPRHEDPEIKQLAESAIAHVRAEDSKLGTVKRKSEAAGVVEFSVGHVFSYASGGRALAVVGWEWIEEDGGAFS